MYSLWIMHKPDLKCRAFNLHSALVYTPIWLALPCFHYSQFLGTQKRLKRLTGMDSVFLVYVGNICFLLKAIGSAKFCLWLLFLGVVIVPQKEGIETSEPTEGQSQLDPWFLKGAVENVSYLHTSEPTAVIREQSLEFWGWIFQLYLKNLSSPKALVEQWGLQKVQNI